MLLWAQEKIVVTSVLEAGSRAIGSPLSAGPRSVCVCVCVCVLGP
jgi:hypothetical protein